MTNARWRVTAVAALAAALLAAGTPCEAGRLYFGAGLGRAEADDLRVDDVGDGSALSGGADGTDDAFKVYAGWRFLRFFSVEVANVDLGRRTIDATSDGTGSLYSAGSVIANVEIDGYSVAGVFVLSVRPRWTLFGKTGALFWDSRGSVRNAGSGERPLDDDGQDPLLGAGLVWDYPGPGSARFEWERFEDVAGRDVGLLSAGIVFRF